MIHRTLLFRRKRALAVLCRIVTSTIPSARRVPGDYFARNVKRIRQTGKKGGLFVGSGKSSSVVRSAIRLARSKGPGIEFNWPIENQVGRVRVSPTEVTIIAPDAANDDVKRLASKFGSDRDS